ncbi:MAG: hypothetical protein KKH97_04020 [Proteobacteria bacterium]|nr:hypothetical protein [Pseudomonadota bacterium]MBU1712645.1 hypothetical protein [Pseudomonadota bacterium]
MLNKELTFYADIPVICPVIKTAKPAVVDFLHHVAEMGIDRKAITDELTKLPGLLPRNFGDYKGYSYC